MEGTCKCKWVIGYSCYLTLAIQTWLATIYITEVYSKLTRISSLYFHRYKVFCICRAGNSLSPCGHSYVDSGCYIKLIGKILTVFSAKFTSKGDLRLSKSSPDPSWSCMVPFAFYRYCWIIVFFYRTKKALMKVHNEISITYQMSHLTSCAITCNHMVSILLIDTCV